MTDGTDTRARLLGELLAECDEPCPACGYNLRGLTGDKCPECGEALRLMAGMVEPRMKLYLAGLVGLAFGTGFDAIIMVWFVWDYLRGWGADEDMLVPLVLGLVFCGGTMLVWLRKRARIRHLRAPVRAALVVGCWLLAFGAGVAFFATVT